MTPARSFETRFNVRARGDVLILMLPEDLDAADVELMKGAVSRLSQPNWRRGYVWDLSALRAPLSELKLWRKDFRGNENPILTELAKCWTATVRRGGHVVFLHGAEFVEFYNTHVMLGGYLEHYATEDEGVAAVTAYLDSARERLDT